MAVSFPATSDTDFCSLITTASKADPAGSAPTYDAFLVVELDLPWKREAPDSAHFPHEVNAALAESMQRGRNVRLQCVMPDPTSTRLGFKRIMYFTRPDGPFVRFQKVEYVVPEEVVVPLTEALLQSDEAPAQFAEYRVETDHVRDLLICTHGARDACCGKFGIEIYSQLQQYCTANPRHNVRVWRSSHLGGHRFAPTVLDLPTGNYWASVTPEIIPLLVSKTGEAAKLRPHYRGWTAFAEPHQQVAEAEMFRRLGWEWFTYERTVRTLIHDNDSDGGTVQINWVDPVTGETGSAHVTIAVGRVITGPQSCGDTPQTSKEYHVTHFEVPA